jgi:hypothetical protein
MGGEFLCASIDQKEEVFMTMDQRLSKMAFKWMPNLKPFLREDSRLTVRVDLAMYGLIQSAKLWYNELPSCLHVLKKRLS